MAEGILTVAPLDEGRVADFWAVHSEGNGLGWCSCTAWWAPDWEAFARATAAENRRCREELFARGHHDGYLLYEDGVPSGWCQCGPRDRLPKLLHQYGLTPDPAMWAMTCFALVPAARGRGLAHRFAARILDDLRCRGVPRVQAFPVRGHDLDEGAVWTGPEALYRGLGFTVEREDPRHPVYVLVMDDTQGARA